MTGQEHIPLYLDWTFWAFVIAALALILSQLPPLHILFRRAKLEVEPYNTIGLTHKLGNPNAQLHIIVTNTGGRKVKISGITVSFRRDRDAPFTLPAKNYLSAPDDKTPVLLTSFQLAPEQEWAHITTFLNFYSREDEREFREIAADHRSDIGAKRAKLTDKTVIVRAEEGVVKRALQFFDRKFVWRPGEYEVTLTVSALPERASVTKKYRCTLFESDTRVLKDITNDYVYGAGIWFESTEPVWVFVGLT